jgi:bacteriorhodopsin
MSRLVYRSAVASLTVQLVVGLATTATFFLPKATPELQTILTLELSSQIVEFLWYLVVVCRDREIRTWTRYLDWVLSTPVMLVSTALFFRMRSDEDDTSVLSEAALWLCLVFNWFMLAFGFVLETVPGFPAIVGLGMGGVAFVGSFTMLARLVDTQDSLSVWLFACMYGVWALYGVAAALPDVPKNVSYNALDVVSKNFYGVFLFVYALTRA